MYGLGPEMGIVGIFGVGLVVGRNSVIYRVFGDNANVCRLC